MASKRGFSSMDPQKQKEIASKGGKAAHQKGTAHEFTAEEAREAGRKGGASTRNRRRAQGAGSEQAGGENSQETQAMGESSGEQAMNENENSPHTPPES